MRIDELEEAAVLLNQPENKPGTIVVLTGETARYTQFAMSVQGLGFQHQNGSVIRWILGNDVAESRNRACAEMHGDWIWFVDDDHTFAADVLRKLLARKVDLVTALCLRRQQPFLPIPCVDDDFMDLARYGPDELVAVDHAGTSGMLIRRAVVEALEPPWFELSHEPDGRPVSEDVFFCRKARAAGFDVHVDMGARLGHLTTAAVWPTWNEEEERWLTGFTIADGASLAIEPAAAPATAKPTEVAA